MILRSLHIAGFGRLAERRFGFAPGLNVVYGPNESGKSTVSNAIVATLYGVDRKKELWRPWNGGPFATTLVYQLANGETIELQRDFDRDAKGLHIYDRNGNEISGKLNGQRLVPGEAHLGVPLDVFLNAACVKQQSLAIDEGRSAGPIAAHLARALDGGPREDAALGAIARLDEALRVHVGTERARKNTPLRTLRESAQAQRAAIAAARGRLEELDDLRDRLDRNARDCERLAAAGTEVERRLRALRAGALAKRLANLREFRAELAALQSDRAAYDDVAAFPTDREREAEDAYYAWEAAEKAAAASYAAAQSAGLSDADRFELDARRRDVGSLDDPTSEALSAAHAHAARARSAATAAARVAASTRLEEEPAGIRNVAYIVGIVALCIAVGCAVAHVWVPTVIAALAAIGALGLGMVQSNERRALERAADAKQRAADAALSNEAAAVNAVTAVLRPLGIERFEDFTARRAQLAELEARARQAEQLLARADASRLEAQAAGARFDAIASSLLPGLRGDRTARRSAIHARAVRRRERDGIDAHLHALEMRRSTILGNTDEYGLEAELAELAREGVEPADEDAPGALRSAENERQSIAESLRAAREQHARLETELALRQHSVGDIADMDERLLRMENDIERLEEFERALVLAKSTLDARTREAHQAFARRLEDYAASTLGAITGGRYAEIFVDPATLAIKVRIPETHAIADLESVSAGTRDQTYLVVRFAMARMFSEGIETPPLLLDDPFAYWDDSRIERCLPILEIGANDGQAILFTSSRELADAAVRRGAQLLDLPEPALV